MYLNKLNSEQKELFLDLCIHAALADKSFAEEEKTIIDEYCKEMQLSNVRYTTVLEYESVVENLIAISTIDELRMIAFEMTALLLSDKHFDEFEKKFIEDFVERIHINSEEIAEMLEILNNLTEIYERVRKFIFRV